MTAETTEIERIEKELGWVIEIEERIPMWNMASVMARDYAQIRNYLQGKPGIETEMGIPYARYLDADREAEMNGGGADKFFRLLIKKRHFYVGIPVGTHLESSGLMNSRRIDRRLYIALSR